MTTLSRSLTTALALMIWATLVTQVFLSLPENANSLVRTLWTMGMYFTILTNLILAVSFTIMGLKRAYLAQAWLMSMTLWIAIVGVVYHTLLAHLYAFTGLDWWTDFSLHTAAPILTALWWLALAPKSGLQFRHAPIALIWPLLYVLYALIRGQFTGTYPYPFIDVSALGWPGVAMNSIGLTVTFALGGLCFVGVGKLISRAVD
ncbi:MAG: Pr6Pr family membrane protein [Maritimibacter sp.]